MTIIHNVPDFERWRTAVFTNPTEDRPGLLRLSVYRSVDDPNEVMVDLEFDSPEAAKAVLRSVDLRDVLDRAGIEVYPPVFIGKEVTDLRFEAP